MSELVIAIILGVSMTLTGCTKAGESTVSDYEQGGYFQEEQQQEDKEVDKPKATTSQHNKLDSEQPVEHKQNNTRINNQQQNNKSTKGIDRVKNNSNKIKNNSDNKKEDTSKQDNQSSQQEATDTECAICGHQVHNGEGITLNDYPVQDSNGNIVSGAVVVHKYCYQHELDDNSKHDI
jgi:outer membrane biosynthesis protein TonB